VGGRVERAADAQVTVIAEMVFKDDVPWIVVSLVETLNLA
jgi:hypothetical protein